MAHKWKMCPELCLLMRSERRRLLKLALDGNWKDRLGYATARVVARGATKTWLSGQEPMATEADAERVFWLFYRLERLATSPQSSPDNPSDIAASGR